MNEAQAVSEYVRQKTYTLGNGSQWSRAMLARLRRCVGKDIRDSQDSWEITLDGLPSELAGKSSPYDFQPSPAENAVHTALTIFALHMQGRDPSASTDARSFAAAIRSIINDSNADGIKRRFDSMVTATDLPELAYHARGLVQMIRTQSDVGFDYPRFARDIYFFQFPDGRRNVLMSWGQEFYTKPFDNKKEE